MTAHLNARLSNGMGAYVAGASGRRPGVLVLQEIFGVNVAMRAVADALAEAGYVACVPDLYHRLEPGVALSYEPEDRPRALALWERLDAVLGEAVADVGVAARDLAAHPNCDGQVAMVGFCLGGKLAMLAAAEGCGEVAVAFYPVQMQAHREAISSIGIPLMVQLGAEDSHVPPPVIELLVAEVGDLPGGQVVIHPEAGHGFYNSFRKAGYAPAAAEAAHAQVLDFLATNLAAAD